MYPLSPFSKLSCQNSDNRDNSNNRDNSDNSDNKPIITKNSIITLEQGFQYFFTTHIKT